MATLPPIKRITREDIKDAPEWISRLLYPLNLFLDSIYGALNKNLTFSQNILSQKQSFSLIASSTAANNTVKFTLTMKSKPSFVFLVGSISDGDNVAPSFTWNFDGVYINITSISGLTNGSTYDFFALVLGD